MERKSTKSHTVIDKVFFVGSKKLGHSILKKLHTINPESIKRVVTIDDTSDERNYFNEFRSFTKENTLPLNILTKPSELGTLIREEKPDLVIVVGWYWIISPEVLEMVPNGLIGIHASSLPQYRGFAPLVWAVINGEKKTGISLFYLSDGIDTGDIIDQRELPIGENSNISSLLDETEKLSLDMIEKNYESILNKSNTRSPQKENKISYCSIRKPEDGLINWSWKNTDIHNFIRAQSDPYPGAFTYINGEKYFLSDSTVIKYPYYGPSGVIAEKNSKYIIVCCGENALKIKNIKKYTSNENIINKMRFGKKFEW
mgnify:CR=1 FL=1|tara:strand:- start:781 stop:1722 length:942 start_codon:yes stop_codon:yes gene_type:complete